VWLTKFCRAVHETRAAIEGYKISDVIEAHLSMPCSSAPNCDNRMTTLFIRYVTMTAGPAQFLRNPRRFPSDDLWFTAALRNRRSLAIAGCDSRARLDCMVESPVRIFAECLHVACSDGRTATCHRVGSLALSGEAGALLV